MTNERSLVPGKNYRIASVVDGSYLVLDGFDHGPSGGLYWTEFSLPDSDATVSASTAVPAMQASHDDVAILDALRAARGRLVPVQLAELLGRLRGELTQSTLVFYFKRAFPDIPLQTILESAAWSRVTGSAMDDTQFNAWFEQWLPGRPGT